MARPEPFPSLVSKWRVRAQSLERQLEAAEPETRRAAYGSIMATVRTLRACADALAVAWRRQQARQKRQGL